MGWATSAIENLKNGDIVTIRPRGNSMKGLIKSGSLVEIKPLLETDIVKKNDIVLCKVNNNQYLHIVSAIKGDQFQISNNLGHINGLITRKNIYGIYVKTIG